MKINPNYLALCKQYLLDSKNCNREEIKELNQTLISETISLEVGDYEKAIMLAKKFKKMDLAEGYIKHVVFYEQNNCFSSYAESAEKFVENLRWELIQNKQRKTKDLIFELIEKEFPEHQQIESVFKFVNEVGLIPFHKLNLQKSGEKVGIQEMDLLDLLHTI
jgi:hypothetical protein